MVNFFFKTLRIVSLIAVLIMFMFCYVQLPDSIAVKHEPTGEPVGFMDKQQFFYLAAALIVGLYLLFGLLRNQFKRLDLSKLNLNSQWANKPAHLSAMLVGWADAFLAFLNFYILFSFYGLNKVNQEIKQRMLEDYSWYLILGGLGLVFFVCFVPLRLLLSKPSEYVE
ncbi:hypothetical protein LAG90_13020 [Marinilongibacter aquaticus]|uniref:hypothetical protein n=1 Tax=Marinilongibacter aquaticus TaxID=2975157 RepID=UPI0021BDEF93|nr:hypothetical protein [Marinilongibacter aquaticus]UBM57734.1 hypothetical protein LAG90_13020 [Marinilongibacter aquaticus]